MTEGQLSCVIEQISDATIIHVRGEVDMATAPRLRQVLIDVLAASPSTHLVVDLSGVEFIDSTGIGVIVGAHKRATARGGRLSAIVTTPAVLRILQTTGLVQAWNVTASLEDALGD